MTDEGNERTAQAQWILVALSLTRITASATSQKGHVKEVEIF